MYYRKELCLNSKPSLASAYYYIWLLAFVFTYIPFVGVVTDVVLQCCTASVLILGSGGGKGEESLHICTHNLHCVCVHVCVYMCVHVWCAL